VVADQCSSETTSGSLRTVSADPVWCFPVIYGVFLDMIENFKLKFGNPLPGYRFKPGECIVDTNSANDFRQGKCTQRDLDGVKMLVAEVGIDNKTGMESYRLLYYSPVEGAEDLPWNQIDQWRIKAGVDLNYELSDHPEI
jgi:hypothetical protein